jgi:hypothetical protein
MNTGGEAAEQIVRMSLNGFEFAAKITGAGAKNIAILLYTILKEEKKTKGKARLTSMLRSGKELKVYTFQNKDLKKFTMEAKKYGVLYCALAERKSKDPNGVFDVIARAEDAAKISRIAERFHLATVDTASIVEEVSKDKIKNADKTKNTDMAEVQIDTPKKEKKEQLLDELMGKPTQKEERSPNPFVAKTDKSPLSEPLSKTPKKLGKGDIMINEKPSVKKALEEIKEERKGKQENHQPVKKEIAKDKKKPNTKGTRHKQPQARRKRAKKQRGGR